jgi:hypothetical protein
MIFENNPQRERYLQARGKIVLNACPGSGKTTCIVQKIPLLEVECQERHGQHSGIICLSFTNVAKNEILKKYNQTYSRTLSHPHQVTTIDSFVNQYITLPFYRLLNSSYSRPRILDEEKTLDRMMRRTYVKNGKSYETIVSPSNRFKDLKGLPLYTKYSPASLWVDINGKFSFSGKMPDKYLVDTKEFQLYGESVFKWKASNGLISSQDSAYIALHLLKKYPHIGEWLISRFPYMIIDEAQDTSALQHALIDQLCALGLDHVELIGDPYQSLYQWRDAKPELFHEKYKNPDWQGLSLSENRRSAQHIIDCFSLLRHQDDELIYSTLAENKNLKILAYKYGADNHGKIIEDFESRCTANALIDNHIVVRGKTLRNKLLGNLAELEPWKLKYPQELLRIRHLFISHHIKEAVDALRKIILELKFPDEPYTELQNTIESYKADYSFNGLLYSFLPRIPGEHWSLQDWCGLCMHVIKDHFGIINPDAFQFKFKLKGFKMSELKKTVVGTYFNKPASASLSIPITTIHQVKGATLDAILCFFNADSIGQNISFKDFHNGIPFPGEKQRMIYVACSRPKQLLAMGFPQKISDQELRGKFGQHIEIITL